MIHRSYLVMLGETTLREAMTHREGKASYPIRSTTSIALGGDDDDPITCTGSIESRGSCILEDGDIRNILSRNIRDTPMIDRSIYNVEWSRRGIDRTKTTDTNTPSIPRLSRRSGDLHPRRGTSQGVDCVRHGAVR